MWTFAKSMKRFLHHNAAFEWLPIKKNCEKKYCEFPKKNCNQNRLMLWVAITDSELLIASANICVRPFNLFNTSPYFYRPNERKKITNAAKQQQNISPKWHGNVYSYKIYFVYIFIRFANVGRDSQRDSISINLKLDTTKIFAKL